MKKLYIIFSVVIIIVFTVIMIFMWSPDKNGSKIDRPNQAVSTDIQPISKEEEIETKNKRTVGDLLEKVPYLGNNFYLDYNYNMGSFILYINPNNKEQGNGEFDAFLIKNNIPSRDWLVDVVVVNKLPSITPAP